MIGCYSDKINHYKINFFLAAGCKRTPKAELIRMDIVKKVQYFLELMIIVVISLQICSFTTLA